MFFFSFVDSVFANEYHEISKNYWMALALLSQSHSSTNQTTTKNKLYYFCHCFFFWTLEDIEDNNNIFPFQHWLAMVFLIFFFSFGISNYLYEYIIFHRNHFLISFILFLYFFFSLSLSLQCGLHRLKLLCASVRPLFQHIGSWFRLWW